MFEEGFKNSQLSMNSTTQLLYVLWNSPEGRRWDIKYNKFNNSFYIFNNMVAGKEPLGNMSWGFIMAAGRWPETVSKMGAGAYQLKQYLQSNKKMGTIQTYFDQPFDYRCVGYGYELYRRLTK